MRPKRVWRPIAVTRPDPWPVTTSVPMNAASPGALSTASDSPVSALSSVESARASISSRSAGSLSPAPISTRSPGTSSRAGSSRSTPSRSTRAVGASIALSAFTAVSARQSCTKPKAPFTTTTSAIASVSA